MQDYIAYLAAQRKTRDLATSALPGAPVRADPKVPTTHSRTRLRRRVAGMLIRTAERLEPSIVQRLLVVGGPEDAPR
jgi:hypothetical protein